jgi:phosphohistidine phosphatase
MKIYLLRHAIAEERRAALLDEDRALTREGRKRMHQVAKSMARLELRFDVIGTSPLLRARQTADIVAKIVPQAPQPAPLDELAPGGSMSRLIDVINGMVAKPVSGILLVGHQPYLGRLLAALIGAGNTAEFELRKAGLCCLELTGPRLRFGQCATLEWLVTPRILLGSRRAG